MSDWTPYQQALLAGALTGVYEDSQSTKEGIRHGGKEYNPLLPAHPSGQELDHAALLTALLGTIGADLLPDRYRAAALGGWAGLEHGLAYKNRNTRVNENAGLMESRIEGPLMMAALGGLLGHLGDKYMGGADVGMEMEGSGKGRKTAITFTKKF